MAARKRSHGIRPRTPKSTRKPPSARSGITDLRLLVADHLSMDRSGLVAILQTQPDFTVVGEASSAEEAITLVTKLRPSVLILALRLPSAGPRNALSVVHSAFPKTPILAVAERGEGQCLVLNPPGSHHRAEAGNGQACLTGTDCLQLAVLDGAAGTIRRSVTPEELYQAVRAVAAGRSWYESGTATSIIRHALAGNGAEGKPGLSPRELEVAEQIARGRSNKEISSALEISEPTVKKHVGRILAKLDLQDRLQVGLYVARNPELLRPLGARRT